MRLSYCTWSAMHTPIGELLPAIAAIGYHGIELAVTPRFPTDLDTLDGAKRAQIKALLADHGLALSAVAGHTSMCALDEDENAQNMDRLRRTIDLAAELRTPGETAIAASLIGGSEDDWGKLRHLVAERVHALGEYAASQNVILALEPHSGTCFDLPRKAVWMMEQVDLPAVRINFDISHFDIMGIPMTESIEQMTPYTVHTHIKDQRGIYPRYQFLVPGAGPFDFIAYVAGMRTAGYDGWVGMEVSVQVQRLSGYNPLTAANLGYWTLVHACEMNGLALR